MARESLPRSARCRYGRTFFSSCKRRLIPYRSKCLFSTRISKVAGENFHKLSSGYVYQKIRKTKSVMCFAVFFYVVGGLKSPSEYILYTGAFLFMYLTVSCWFLISSGWWGESGGSSVVMLLKGTQDWEFFWLRFWNLRYFFVSHIKTLRFYNKIFLIGPL